jgi:hypothetical protein
MNYAGRSPTFPVRQIKFPISAANFPVRKARGFRAAAIIFTRLHGADQRWRGPQRQKSDYIPIQTGSGRRYTSVTAPVRSVINR